MQAGYKQFCPVAMASEILCNRWTMVLLRELVAGSTRFNDLRKGVPRMSPALLSQRLKELAAAGIIEIKPVTGDNARHEYCLTEAGRDLKAVVEAVGIWGQRWVGSELTLENLDPSLLMWDMRRNLDPTPLPKARTVVAFIYTDLAANKSCWWLIVEPTSEVDLCSVDPGFDVNLYVRASLRAMTSVWMGISTLKHEIEGERISIDGADALTSSMQKWLGLSPFAAVKSRRPIGKAL